MAKKSGGIGIIPEFNVLTVEIPIKGISPLVVHAFDQKAILMIQEKEQKIKKPTITKHDVRIPEEEYEASKHKSDLGWEGFPASGFKKSILRAAKNLEMVMKDIQTQFFIIPDDSNKQLVRIYGESHMRQDMVKIAMGSTIRYRAEYSEWKAILKIQYMAHKLNIDIIEQLIKMGGFCAGIGEMRREKTADNYGQYDIDESYYKK